MPGVAYADASALVKLVLDERGSAEMRADVTGLDHVFVSEIGEVEVGLVVRRRGGDAATAAWRGILQWLDLVTLDPAVRSAAIDLSSAPLRALDAIHLASALSLGPVTDRFLCYDLRLAEAARAMGLRVESPGIETG